MMKFEAISWIIITAKSYNCYVEMDSSQIILDLFSSVSAEKRHILVNCNFVFKSSNTILWFYA